MPGVAKFTRLGYLFIYPVASATNLRERVPMIYSNACAYTIRAMTQLALVGPDRYVLLDEICAGTDLPRHFVAKLFQDLVRTGLLISAKGRGGGFALARPPGSISLFDIVAAVDGKQQFDACVVGMARCNDKQPCPQHDEWTELKAHLLKYLHGTTLEKAARTYQKKLDLLGKSVPEPRSRSKPLKKRR